MAHLFGYNRAHAFFARNRYAHPSHLRLASRPELTVKAAKLNIRLFLTGCWRQHKPIRWMRLLLPVMFSIPARRPVTPARYTTVLLSIYSKRAVIWWYWQGNHDSVATLNESRDIMAFLNTTVVASAGHAPQILPVATGRRRSAVSHTFYARVTLLPAGA